MKKLALIFTYFFVFLLAESILIGSVCANFTPLPDLPSPIYITENGNIEGTNGTLQQNGNVYTFTADISKTIEIQKDDVIINGNGFTLTKPPEVNTQGLMTPIGWFPSIQITNKDNVTIKNINFDKCYTGISIVNSSNIVVIQNTIHNGNEGIYISASSYCNIIGNEIVDHGYTGLSIKDSSYLNIAYNNIARNHFHGAWIATANSNITRNNVTDNSFDHFGIGLYLYGVNSNNQIFENNFINNEIGLFYQGAKGTSLNNTVYDNYWKNYDSPIINVAGDSVSGVDQSPLTNPISTVFDESVFFVPDDIPEFPSCTPILIALVAVTAITIIYRLAFKKVKLGEIHENI